MTETISRIKKALEHINPKENKPLHHRLYDVFEESAFVWRKDFTIAVAKDDSKTKVANLLLCTHLDETAQTFKVKREHDFWKKLQAREDYRAVVECSNFPKGTDVCEIETVGRNIMRSRKEVPTVAGLEFIWVVQVELNSDIENLLQLYFKENYLIVNREASKYYIAWAESLKGIDMRHFVCNPAVKK